MLKSKIKKDILDIISNERLIKERINKLKKMGYNIVNARMGSGGVGQVRELKTEYRIQIGYGYGRYNYAYCVIITK